MLSVCDSSQDFWETNTFITFGIDAHCLQNKLIDISTWKRFCRWCWAENYPALITRDFLWLRYVS